VIAWPDALTGDVGFTGLEIFQMAKVGVPRSVREAGLLGQMSPETRKTVADVFAAIRPTLDQLLDKALAIPGVGAVIKPAADAIRAKLDELATI